MLALSCNSGEVRGLFCKIASARAFPGAGHLRVGRPHVGRACGPLCAHYVAWAAHVGRAGEFVFLFHKELEIVF